eukprot:jgi/Psemu1/26032/gm1.26032_g
MRKELRPKNKSTNDVCRNYNSDSDSDCDSALSSFLLPILEECKAKSKGTTPGAGNDDCLTRERSERELKRSLSSRIVSNEYEGDCEQVRHSAPTTASISLVSDNAKTHTIPLMRRLNESSFINCSPHSDKDACTRGLSAGKIYETTRDHKNNDCGGNIAIGVFRQNKNRDFLLHYDHDPNLLVGTAMDSMRSTSFILQNAISIANERAEQCRYHRSCRWSPNSSRVSTAQRFDSANFPGVDVLPKRCSRRPSI